MQEIVNIIAILILLEIMSMCTALAFMIVTYFRIRKINLWAFWSIMCTIITVWLKDIILQANTEDIKYRLLLIFGIIFTILLGIICFKRNSTQNGAPVD